MCNVPPDGILLSNTLITASVTVFTFLCILSLAAALPDSLARKAFVIATFILSASNSTTFPFLLITLSFPGAVTSSSFFISGVISGFVVCCCVVSIFFVFLIYVTAKVLLNKSSFFSKTWRRT